MVHSKDVHGSMCDNWMNVSGCQSTTGMYPFIHSEVDSRSCFLLQKESVRGLDGCRRLRTAQKPTPWNYETQHPVPVGLKLGGEGFHTVLWPSVRFAGFAHRRWMQA